MVEREREFWIEIKEGNNSTVTNVDSSSELAELHAFFNNLKGDNSRNSQLIEMGSILEYKEHKYEVKNIVLTLYKLEENVMFSTVLKVEKV